MYLVSSKFWLKRAKKLVEYKDYILIDGTGDESGELSKFANVVSLDGFSMSKALIDAKKNKDDERIDSDKRKIMERKFFDNKDKSFMLACMSVAKALIKHDGEVNIFIVIKNSAYKTYAKRMKKEMYKLLGDGDFEFIYMEEDIENDKKLLKKNIKSKALKGIYNSLADLEKGLEKESKKKDKKKKKKSK
jgi:hypothetical protein